MDTTSSLDGGNILRQSWVKGSVKESGDTSETRWVVATEEKVILDVEITDREPSYVQLIPLLSRIKKRLGEEEIKKVVSDEDFAIIDSVKVVLPNAQLLRLPSTGKANKNISGQIQINR